MWHPSWLRPCSFTWTFLEKEKEKKTESQKVRTSGIIAQIVCLFFKWWKGKKVLFYLTILQKEKRKNGKAAEEKKERKLEADWERKEDTKRERRSYFKDQLDRKRIIRGKDALIIKAQQCQIKKWFFYVTSASTSVYRQYIFKFRSFFSSLFLILCILLYKWFLSSSTTLMMM